MKKYMLPLLVAAIGLLAFTPAGDSKKNFEGKITYAISYEDLPEEMEEFSHLLPKEMTMFVKDEKVRIEQNTGMGNTITIMNNSTREGYILMHMLGWKNAYKISPEDEEEKNKKKPRINYIDNDTKTIAGYTCKKAEIWMDEDEDEPLVLYYTEDLPSGTHREYKYVKGFPMEYTIHNSGMSLTMSVASISKEKVPDAYFEVPEGYAIKSYEELKNLRD